MLYIAGLHPTIPQGLAISYVDDLTITVGSDSLGWNIRSLQDYFRIIPRQGANMGVAFSVPKSELIHWRTPKDRSDVSFAPIVINDMLFPPSQVVRWLGYWLTPPLHSSVHGLRRLALAKASFTTIRQLSAAGKGLSSWCNRKLVFGVILPIRTYSCDLVVPDTATLKRLNLFWHVVLRWITNCFYTTAQGALYGEASLPRISWICKHRRRSAAMRFICASSEFNPATARLPESVPSWDQGRSADNHHFLLRFSSKAVHLTSCLSPAVNSAKPLPLDSLCHEVSDLVEEISILPLASTDLVALPLLRIPSFTYQAFRAPLLQSLLADWLDLSPPVPLSNAYSPSLTPHAFTGLPRFICGRIHQMRTGASYLAAHVSWRRRDSSTLCPFCEEDDESFQHAIRLCPAKAEPRLTHLSGVDDIGPDGPLWFSVPLLRGLAEDLYATHTGFTPTMLRIQSNTATPQPGSGSDSA